MARELNRVQKIEQSIVRRFRKELWAPFLNAITKYELIQPGDCVLVKASHSMAFEDFVAVLEKL